MKFELEKDQRELDAHPFFKGQVNKNRIDLWEDTNIEFKGLQGALNSQKGKLDENFLSELKKRLLCKQKGVEMLLTDRYQKNVMSPRKKSESPEMGSQWKII